MKAMDKIILIMASLLAVVIVLYVTDSLDPNIVVFLKRFGIIAAIGVILLNRDTLSGMFRKDPIVDFRMVFKRINDDLEKMPSATRLQWGDDRVPKIVRSRTYHDKKDNPHHFIAIVAKMVGSQEMALALYELSPVFKYWDFITPVSEELRNDPFLGFYPFVRQGYYRNPRSDRPKVFSMSWGDEIAGDGREREGK